MIYLFGLSIASFLFLLIQLKKNKSNADRTLLIWLVVLIVNLFLFYLQYSGISYQYPHTLGLLLPVPILHGVFLYVYANELTGKSMLNAKKMALHLIPFFSLTLLAIPFFLLTGQEKMNVFQNEGAGFEWYSIIQLVSILISGFAYSIATLYTIRKHRKSVMNFFSNNEEKMLGWLEYLTIGLAAIWMLSVFFDDHIIFGGVVLFVLFIGLFGVTKVPVFHSVIPSQALMESEVTDSTHTNQEKYSKTKLKEEEISRIMANLGTYMGENKPFKNSELSLNELAEMLHVPPHQLSQVINTTSGKTFYHYINSCRVEEFLKVANEPENQKFTYLAIAFDCGFNSKTTFNKHFKLTTGKTPSEYFKN